MPNVTAAGTYDDGHEVLVVNRSFNGLPGYHVLTPLLLADGRAVLVNRGWIPIAQKVGAPVVAPPPPTGALTITGRVRKTQTRGIIGPRDATAGALTVLARADVARVATQVPYPLVPAYLELTAPAGSGAADASADAVPRLLPLPDLSEGPHLSYAVQWLIFTLCAAGGWIAVVRRQLRLDRQRAAKAVTNETTSVSAP
jgi:cytochrome oxidase assembly protein ShyY1